MNWKKIWFLSMIKYIHKLLNDFTIYNSRYWFLFSFNKSIKKCEMSTKIKKIF